MIKKVKEGYRVLAKTGRNMGTYPSEAKAKARVEQMDALKDKLKSYKK